MTAPEPGLPDRGERRDYPPSVPDFFLSASNNAAVVENLMRILAAERRRLFQVRMAIAERRWRGGNDDVALKNVARTCWEQNNDLFGKLTDEEEHVRAELAAAEADLRALEQQLALEPFSFSVQDFFRRRKTVVSIDLVDYGGDARYRQDNFGVALVGELDDRIKQMIDTALRRCQHNPATTVIRFTGDGVNLNLDHPHHAITFANVFFQLAEEHNAQTPETKHRWWFRMGAADGELVYRQQGADRLEPAGNAIIVAVRLQSASCPGVLLVDEAFFAECAESHQGQFEPEVTVARGKRDEESYEARRLILLRNAAAEAEAAGRWKPKPPA